MTHTVILPSDGKARCSLKGGAYKGKRQRVWWRNLGMTLKSENFLGRCESGKLIEMFACSKTSQSKGYVVWAICENSSVKSRGCDWQGGMLWLRNGWKASLVLYVCQMCVSTFGFVSTRTQHDGLGVSRKMRKREKMMRTDDINMQVCK